MFPSLASGEAMLQYFNTSWAEITRRMPELAEAGYTSLWLPPPTKGSGGLSVGYDLWDPFDLGGKEQRGTFNTRYGTEAELHRLIEMAHRFGIRVYFDNIMNHRAFDVPGYNDFAPPYIYPGMRPEDFHLRRTEDGYYRKWDNVREWWSEWQVQNLGLADLVDIATEPGTTNRNFGAWEGATTEKIKFLRHPNNPEYYCYDANGTYVGFGKNNGLTSEYLQQHEAYYSEYVEAYLNRAVRWLMDRTKADGLRLDAVKHIPADFFGATFGDDRDRSNYGYLGQAQEQFNLTRGFSDWGNHRDTVFDTELPRDDAMMFGEHLGAPPAVGDYFNSGMRLLDNDLRHHLNSQLGNPWGTLAGMDAPGSHGFAPGSSVMHAQSHDSDYAARRELQHALYLTRGGIGIIYSDGNHKAGLLKGSGGAFPRHANTNFLGQWGDNRIPNLLYFHEHFARGYQVGRWSDGDVVVYERVDKRENPGMSDAAGTVGLVMINDNYSSGQTRGFTTGFPAVGGTDNDAYLYNYSSYGGGFYKYASQLNQVVIPAGGYFLFSWRSPESSDLWELAGGHPLSILQDDKEVGTISVQRIDGPDGDPGFNPYGVSDPDPTDFSYSWNVPRVTNGANLKFVVRADGSAENVLLKLDGGVDVNGNGQRDNPPALSTDLYLGYEQMNFTGRQGPEKFAARDASRNMIGSAGAETYWWHADNGTFSIVNGGTGADSFPNETAHWVYHDPEQNNDQGEKQFQVTNDTATIWVKVGYRLEVNQARLYYVSDESNPEGAGGEGLGTTQTISFAFSHADGQEPTVDWWKASIPLPESGVLKYKIGVYRNESNGVALASVFPKNEPSVALKKKMLTTFEISGFNADAIVHRPHNDWGQTANGLKEGFHFLKGRAFLSRLGQAPIYNTFTRTFYYDAKRPEGEVVFPAADGDELFGSEYGFVVRTDPSVTEVLFHIEDSDATNDDGHTGALNGNGQSGEGNATAWSNAMEITSRQDVGANFPKEWKFSYRNVPSGGGEATIRIALKEISSSSNLQQSEEEGHFRILTRTVKTSGPTHRLFATWPQSDGEKVGQDYVMKTYLSSSLVDGKSDAEIIANLIISIDDSIGQEPPYASAVAQDVSSAWVEREVIPGLTALAYRLPILRNPEGAPDDFQQTIIVDYKDEGAGVDLRTIRAVTTDFISHGPVNPIVQVNGVNANYTSTHLFVDEVKETEESLEIILEAPHVTVAEVYTNLNNRDRAASDSNGDGIEDGIQPPDRDSVSQANDNGYYQVHAMTFDASRGEAGAWVRELNASKTGAYRLTVRFKLEDDADVWHWYTSDGKRDHAIVVSPITARQAIMYELNPLSVDASGDSFATRSTFEDLHDENRWNLDYLKGMGANWLWFQPIHPRGEDGRENVNGQTYDPGSPYAVKNFFEVMPQLSNANTRPGSMQAFRDFVTAADAKGVNVMVDAPFNHVAWDVELDEQGVEIFGIGSADNEIRTILPGFFSRADDYGSPARNESEIATAPDRDDFGKWNDVKDVYFGNYSALARGNDPAERNPHQNEEDAFDFTGPGWNEQTRKTWKYFASYVPYWLEKTGLPAGQTIAVQTQTGIDGLRADFGQGLPPQLWEYVINVARTRKWSFVFMSEALDGGAVTYRSSRHFDVLNENLLFSLQSADSPGTYREAIENRRAAYGQNLVLLNNVSHDEENYQDPWQALIRYAAVNAHAGIPMAFMGQELGISRTYGFNHYETNFGKQIPHFKRYNSMQPIWDNDDFGLDQLYKAYASIGRARSESSALRSSHRYFLNETSTNAAHAKIHAVAKWDQPVASPETSDVVLAFVNLDRDNQQSGTFDLSPGGNDTFLGIEKDHLYNVSNLAAFRVENQGNLLWAEARTGQDLLDNGIFVMLNPVPTSDEVWSTAPYEAQFLKLHDLTTPLLEVNASMGGNASGNGRYAHGSNAIIHAIPNLGYAFDIWVGDGVSNPSLAQTTVDMSRSRSVTATFKVKIQELVVQAMSGGSVSGDGNFTYGSSAAIQATPASNHVFVHWTGAGIANSTSASTTVAMTADRSVTAVFASEKRYLGTMVSGNGSVSGGGAYDHGSTVNLSATADPGHHFVNWTGSSVADANSAATTITLSADANVTANFEPDVLQLIVNSSGNGSASGGGNYNHGQHAAINANPASGFYFTGWSGAGVVDLNSTSTQVTMTQNRTVTAHFAAIPPNQRVLQTFSNPAVAGSTGGGGTFNENTTATLHATPAEGHYFLGWSALNGTLLSPLSQNAAMITLDQGANAIAWAHFGSINRAIVVHSSTGGSVTGEGNYSIVESVAITAVPNENYTFAGWETGGTVAIAVSTGPRQHLGTANAYFLGGQESPPLTLVRGNVYSFILDGATTTNHPFYISADSSGGGNSYLGEYLDGVTNSRATSGTVTLSVNENTPDTLFYYCGLHAGMGSQITIIDGTGLVGDENATSTHANAIASYAIQARFALANRVLSLTAGTGGNVSGSGAFAHGTNASISATPNPGYLFSSWSGEGTTDANASTTLVAMSADRSLTANFEPVVHTLTVASPSEAQGSVIGGGNFSHGETASISANPATGYVFSSWTGSEVADPMTGSTTVNVLSSQTITANFSLASHQVVLLSHPDGAGVVEGAGSFAHGSDANLMATPNEGYVFSHWSGEGIADENSSTTSVSMSEDRNLTANFELASHSLSVSASPLEGGYVAGAGSFTHGDSTSISAIPATGYVFSNWNGNGIADPNSSSTSVTVTSPNTVTASFVQATHTVTLQSDPAQAGNLSGGGAYPYGSVIDLNASATHGYAFSHWSGFQQTDYNQSALSTTLFNDLTLTAHFVTHSDAKQLSYELNATEQVGGWKGSLWFGFFHQADDNWAYHFDFDWIYVDEVTDEAFWYWHGALGWLWTNREAFPAAWSKDKSDWIRFHQNVTGNLQTDSLGHLWYYDYSQSQWTLSQDVEETPSYAVNVDSSPSIGGSVSGAGVYEEGKTVTLTASPADGYEFRGWSGDSQSSTATLTFTITGSVSLTAIFEKASVEQVLQGLFD